MMPDSVSVVVFAAEMRLNSTSPALWWVPARTTSPDHVLLPERFCSAPSLLTPRPPSWMARVKFKPLPSTRTEPPLPVRTPVVPI
jgi:hypothetical protein